MLKLTEQDVIDLRSAIADAMAELCLATPGFEESHAQAARWQALDDRLDKVVPTPDRD